MRAVNYLGLFLIHAISSCSIEGYWGKSNGYKYKKIKKNKKIKKKACILFLGVLLFHSVQETRAQIAQLVEQRTENPRVTGSIPVLGT